MLGPRSLAGGRSNSFSPRSAGFFFRPLSFLETEGLSLMVLNPPCNAVLFLLQKSLTLLLPLSRFSHCAVTCIAIQRDSFHLVLYVGTKNPQPPPPKHHQPPPQTPTPNKTFHDLWTTVIALIPIFFRICLIFHLHRLILPLRRVALFHFWKQSLGPPPQLYSSHSARSTSFWRRLCFGPYLFFSFP